MKEIVHLAPDIEKETRTFVAELRDPIQKMLQPVMENIEHGDYQLLIGDDASGRIPALIVREVINGVYARNGHSPIPTRFIAGTRNYKGPGSYEDEFSEKEKEVFQYLRDLQTSVPELRNAIIVTDTTASGSSLRPVTDSLTELGIHFDILTVGNMMHDADGQEETERLLGGPIFSGQDDVPHMYNIHEISGVEKIPEDLHATPIRKSVPEENSLYVQQEIIIARDEAKRVAADILSDYS